MLGLRKSRLGCICVPVCFDGFERTGEGNVIMVLGRNIRYQDCEIEAVLDFFFC